MKILIFLLIFVRFLTNYSKRSWKFYVILSAVKNLHL